MSKFFTIALVALLAFPAVGVAQTTSDSVDSVLPPDYQPAQETDLQLASSSQSTSSADTQQRAETTLADLQEIIDSEEIAHDRISVNFGLRHRFDESPRGLLDSSLGPGNVFNQQLLELYLGQEVLQEHIRTVSVDEEEAQFEVKGRSELLGFISVHSWYEVSAQLDPSDTDVEVSLVDRWYNFAISPENTGVRAEQMNATLSSGRYLSRLQLAAAVVDTAKNILAGSDIDTSASGTPRG